jgi:glycine cleavage system H protein
VSDVYSPVSGTVVEKNPEVEANPELINTDPYGKGWLVAVEGAGVDLDSLMSAEEYLALVGDA